MSAIIAFSFENQSVRTLGTPEIPLFVAVDVAGALGFKDRTNAVKQHVDAEDLIKAEIDTNGGRQTVNCVNKSGLYALIFGSKLETAKRFKRWVTSEVLPTIRKTGRYEGPRQTITEAQQREIQREVGRKAASTKQFAVVYRALKDRFAIPRYTALLSRDFDEAIRFIRAIELPPVLPKEEQKPAPLPKPEPKPAPAPQPAHHSGACPCCGLTPVEEGDVVLNSYEAERLATFFYFLFYLCKREYEAFYKMLRTVNSPLAGKFFDAFHEIRMLGIDDILAEHGHAIQDLKCYQNWASHQLATK